MLYFHRSCDYDVCCAVVFLASRYSSTMAFNGYRSQMNTGNDRKLFDFVRMFGGIAINLICFHTMSSIVPPQQLTRQIDLHNKERRVYIKWLPYLLTETRCTKCKIDSVWKCMVLSAGVQFQFTHKVWRLVNFNMATALSSICVWFFSRFCHYEENNIGNNYVIQLIVNCCLFFFFVLLLNNINHRHAIIWIIE